MEGINRNLPDKIYLTDFGGNYTAFIDALYDIFQRDFIRNKTYFGSHKLELKFHPMFQDRAYTFYHITHEGEDETNRTPDLRRCECMSWANPVVENAEIWELRFWKQYRKKGIRVCIWLDNDEDVDYFVVLDVRKTYVLLWTTFVAERTHEKNKKEREYNQWLKKTAEKVYTPDMLIEEIMREL